MKIIIAILMLAASTLPAYAGTHCYNYQGRTICCTTIGNYTSCF